MDRGPNRRLPQPSLGTLALGSHRALWFLDGFSQNVVSSRGKIGLENLGCVGQRSARGEGGRKEYAVLLLRVFYGMRGVGEG